MTHFVAHIPERPCRVLLGLANPEQREQALDAARCECLLLALRDGRKVANGVSREKLSLRAVARLQKSHERNDGLCA